MRWGCGCDGSGWEGVKRRSRASPGPGAEGLETAERVGAQRVPGPCRGWTVAACRCLVVRGGLFGRGGWDCGMGRSAYTQYGVSQPTRSRRTISRLRVTPLPLSCPSRVPFSAARRCLLTASPTRSSRAERSSARPRHLHVSPPPPRLAHGTISRRRRRRQAAARSVAASGDNVLAVAAAAWTVRGVRVR